MSNPEFDPRNMQLGARAPVERVMLGFVIDAEGGGGTGGGEVVDADPGEDFGGCPGVVVCPVMEFFVDPGKETDGAVT